MRKRCKHHHIYSANYLLQLLLMWVVQKYSGNFALVCASSYISVLDDFLSFHGERWRIMQLNDWVNDIPYLMTLYNIDQIYNFHFFKFKYCARTFVWVRRWSHWCSFYHRKLGRCRCNNYMWLVVGIHIYNYSTYIHVFVLLFFFLNCSHI